MCSITPELRWSHLSCTNKWSQHSELAMQRISMRKGLEGPVSNPDTIL